MGNCIRRESSSKMEWADQDWGSFKSKHVVEGDADDHGEKLSLLGGQKIGFASSSPSSCKREVKIKISRKELEELMQRVDMQGLTLEQVLARLITNVDDSHDHRCRLDHHQRLWRPVLQSIPEVN